MKYGLFDIRIWPLETFFFFPKKEIDHRGSVVYLGLIRHILWILLDPPADGIVSTAKIPATFRRRRSI